MGHGTHGSKKSEPSSALDRAGVRRELRYLLGLARKDGPLSLELVLAANPSRRLRCYHSIQCSHILPSFVPNPLSNRTPGVRGRGLLGGESELRVASTGA